MNDDASLLTNSMALLERFKNEERIIEMELRALQVRAEIISDVISSLTGKRVGRPRKPRVIDPPETAAEATEAFDEVAA